MWNALRLALGVGLALFALEALGQDSGQACVRGTAEPKKSGILLEKLSWNEAENVLTPDKVVVIPLGAESKEHGQHLQLNNDWLMAEYFKVRVLEDASVVVAPTINYSYYPAFLEYPGSTSVSQATAQAMVAEIVRSLAHYGPRKFYIINTGISTLRPLKAAADELAKDGILMRYLDFTQDDPVEKKWRKSGGTHADEIETAMMLYIAPESVRMEKAKRDLNPNQPGGVDARSEGQRNVFAHGSVGRPDTRHARRRPGACGNVGRANPQRDRGSPASKSWTVVFTRRDRRSRIYCASRPGWIPSPKTNVAPTAPTTADWRGNPRCWRIW